MPINSLVCHQQVMAWRVWSLIRPSWSNSRSDHPLPHRSPSMQQYVSKRDHKASKQQFHAHLSDLPIKLSPDICKRLCCWSIESNWYVLLLDSANLLLSSISCRHVQLWSEWLIFAIFVLSHHKWVWGKPYTFFPLCLSAVELPSPVGTMHDSLHVHIKAI